MLKTYYFDMDGVIANFHKAFKVNRGVALSRKGMAELEPFTTNIELIKNLIADGHKVYILTKAANENGKMGKVDFIKKHLANFDLNNFICIVGSGKKIDFIKEDGILVDDDMKNIKPWVKAGQQACFVEEKGGKIAL